MEISTLKADGGALILKKPVNKNAVKHENSGAP
jgi:hypothetical protein